MAQFTNFATLSYNGATLSSNTVVGELLEPLTVAKSAAAQEYAPGEDLAYIITLSNTSAADLTGLTVTDDLGGYSFGTETVYPLAYQPGTLRLFVNGAQQAAPAVTAGPPLTVTGLSVPAGGSAVIVYEAAPTAYASPAPGAEITNTASVTGAGLSAPLTASATLPAAAGPVLRISKALSPAVLHAGEELTYSFLIENSGGAPVTAEGTLVLADTFQPALSGISVALDGAAWAKTTNYTYDEATGVFSTVAGQLTLPAAQFTQGADGAWTVTPATALLTVTGTLQA